MENLNLKEIIVRNSKSKFYFHEIDSQGYVFHREDRKKGIRITEKVLMRLVNGEHLRLDFGSSGKGVFFIDWTLRDMRIKDEEKQKERKIRSEKGKQLEEYISSVISNEDVDVIAYASYLNNAYEREMPISIHHKHFVYAVRNRDFSYLKSWLAHSRGWNDASKKFFTKMTGVKLPQTKKGILETLEKWCNQDRDVA